MKPHQRHHIVILGAGFAGLAAALELERLRQFSKHEYNVTLIDKNCYHLYHALLYEVATAKEMVKPKDLEALQRGVCIRIKALGEILLKHQVSVVQDTVVRINPNESLVQLTDGSSLHFDELIVAIGSVSNDFGIPGMNQYAIALKELPDALHMNLELQTAIQRAKDGAQVRIMIGGGGVSGVETAGEMQHYLQRVRREEGLKLGQAGVEVHVLEAAPTILPGFDSWAQQAAMQRLDQLGVWVHTGQPIAKVEQKHLTLKDGTVMPYDVLLWSGGIKAHPLVSQLGTQCAGNKGQACVQPSLQLSNNPHIFVVGDNAFILDEKTKRPVSQTAPEAVAQGLLAATNIFRQIHAQPLKSYTPTRSGFVFPVGGRWAISTMYGWKVKGFLGWLIRKKVDLDYFLSILTWRNAWSVFWTGGRVYLRND